MKINEKKFIEKINEFVVYTLKQSDQSKLKRPHENSNRLDVICCEKFINYDGEQNETETIISEKNAIPLTLSFNFPSVEVLTVL